MNSREKFNKKKYIFIFNYIILINKIKININEIKK